MSTHDEATFAANEERKAAALQFEQRAVLARDLSYNGTPMEWKPKRILCLQPFGPLAMNEPENANILDILADGNYSVFVNLQPGDGTQYGLLLGMGSDDTFTATSVGVVSTGGIVVDLNVPMTPQDCRPLAPNSHWSRVLLAWWLNGLRCGRTM